MTGGTSWVVGWEKQKTLCENSVWKKEEPALNSTLPGKGLGQGKRT